MGDCELGKGDFPKPCVTPDLFRGPGAKQHGLHVWLWTPQHVRGDRQKLGWLPVEKINQHSRAARLAKL